MRPWVRRRSNAVAEARRMASDFLGAGPLIPDHADIGFDDIAKSLERNRHRSMDWARLCLTVQHVDWLRVLVSRPGAWRYRRCWTTATIAAIPRIGISQSVAGRTGCLDDDCGYWIGRILRCTSRALCIIPLSHQHMQSERELYRE